MGVVDTHILHMIPFFSVVILRMPKPALDLSFLVATQGIFLTLPEVTCDVITQRHHTSLGLPKACPKCSKRMRVKGRSCFLSEDLLTLWPVFFEAFLTNQACRLSESGKT